MQIIDALRRSNTAEEISILLTNYIETLQFYAAAEHLPLRAVVLPVDGVDDIEKRISGLREASLRDFARSHSDAHGEIVNEAEAVFYEALCCMKLLGNAARLKAPAPTGSGAHTNNFSSICFYCSFCHSALLAAAPRQKAETLAVTPK